MRIVVAHSQLNTLGGGERVVLELLRHLSRAHEVTLWAGGYRPELTYPELAAFPRRDLTTAEWLYRVPDADLVVTHSFGAHLLALRHPATICYVHTLRSRYLRGNGRPDLVARRWLDRRALRRAAALATNSDFSARAIARRYGRAAQVIRCGAAPELLALPATPGTYALYVGRLAPEKGLDRLLRWSLGLPLALHIAGNGDARYTAHLRTLAGPHVRWLGPLRGDDLARAYAGARCVVMLADAEEFGLAALEGMAAARPVVALRSGGLPELVADDVSGLLVDDKAGYRRAVERLAADAALAARLGAAGRERARAYTWEAMAAAVETLGWRVLEQQGAPRTP
ncbi:MAG TPA: glycosyltransferase family 4 protein [Ktedonobacterales bacterium]|nr:glycosyltransferase family 4 protein [Ktedonobacterales bacterium]